MNILCHETFLSPFNLSKGSNIIVCFFLRNLTIYYFNLDCNWIIGTYYKHWYRHGEM